MTDLTLRAGRICTPQGLRSGVVRVHDGVITAVAEDRAGSTGATESSGPADGVEIRLGTDEVLLPGLVDSHVHVNEPGRTEWEGFQTATAAAAAGGVTTIVDMPLNSIPATVDVASLAVKQRATKGKLAVDVAFWGGAVPGNADDLEPLWRAGVVGFKCFLLPSGVDEFPPLDRAGLLTAMRAIAGFDGLLIAHAEDQAVLDRAPAVAGRRYQSFLGSRPPEAESSAIAMLIDAMRETGCRTHIVHLSAASALPLIEAARAEGLPLTVETCPHYLSLTAEQIADGATQFKCCPPIREAGNRDLLWDALGAGVIDLIVSDHSPATRELKRLDTGDFAEAWGGIASLQLGLPIIWSEARQRGYQLSDVIRWMATGPARLAGLDRAGFGQPPKGAIAPGHSADLVAFAPDESFVVDPSLLQHRNPISPYATRRLHGVIRQTWLRGELVREHGTGEFSRRGRLLSRASA